MEIFYNCSISNEYDNSMFRQISTIIKKDGPVGFYRGVSANLLSALCGSLILVTYDVIKERFNQLMEPKVFHLLITDDFKQPAWKHFQHFKHRTFLEH